MPKFTLVLKEHRTQIRYFEIEAEADTLDQAAELAIEQYGQEDKFFEQLDATLPDDTWYEAEIAHHDEAGIYHVLVPMDH
jgi:hypothetical protein